MNGVITLKECAEMLAEKAMPIFKKMADDIESDVRILVENKMDETLLDTVTTKGLNVPVNIICNGFNMKKVILDVLNDPKHDCSTNKELAEDIQEAFTVKLGLKQGKI